MKKLVLALFTLALSSAAIAADPNFAGAWKMESEVAGNSSVAILTFKQEGNKLTGTTKGEDGEAQAIDGAVDGKKITWKSQAEWSGTTLTIVYTGALNDAGLIVGSVEVQPMGIEGEFSAKREEKQATEAK